MGENVAVDTAATGYDDVAAARFVERFAMNFSEAGVPRMPARVFASILAAKDGRRTAAELAELLQISPAAVSGAVRYLLQVGLVAREREPGSRRDHFRLYDDSWYESIMKREKILHKWEEDLRFGIAALGKGEPASARLEETLWFIEYIHAEIPRMLSQWAQRRAELRAQRTAS